MTEAHRYYSIVDGHHVEGLYDIYPGRLRPLLRCAESVRPSHGLGRARQAPAAGHVYAKHRTGDIVNTCRL